MVKLIKKLHECLYLQICFARPFMFYPTNGADLSRHNDALSSQHNMAFLSLRVIMNVSNEKRDESF